MKSTSDKPSEKSLFRWYDIILLRVIPPLVALLVKLLMLSCRVIRVEGQDREREAVARSNEGAIYATWHQRMAYHFHYFGGRHVTVMISQSRDGEYAARMAKWLGFRNVRGSSTRGGRAAIKELIQKIKGGAIGGMLADGPLGPARVAKKGAVVMARDCHVPLIPIVWGSDRCWMLNTWDRYLIPKPFARVVFCFAEPVWVPRSASTEELESFRILLENRLNEGTSWCDAQFGPERPWRKVKGNGIPEVGPLPAQDNIQPHPV